jgi:hypothetical protein
MTTNPEAIETSPASIDMGNLMSDLGVEDAIFLDAMEDPDYAKAYGLQHWASLSSTSHAAWSWVFGCENRLPGGNARELSRLYTLQGAEHLLPELLAAGMS